MTIADPIATANNSDSQTIRTFSNHRIACERVFGFLRSDGDNHVRTSTRSTDRNIR
jgi:hypothetical protein